MRTIGFSTGALAYSDFRCALRMLNGKDIHAVELSALREEELGPLVSALDDLDLTDFNYISVHAPSRFDAQSERVFVEMLVDVDRNWPVIVHPDAIHDYSLWRELGSLLCLENMDKRKPIGRTVHELAVVFEQLPESSFCFDIGHARQFDSTMTEAYLMLKAFGERLCQVHLSEVNTRSKHDVLSSASILAFQEVAHLIPERTPIILETPVQENAIQHEILRAREALPVNPNVRSTQAGLDELAMYV